MSRRANPTLVGGFILGGLALTVAAILLLGSGKLFKDTVEYISWFEGSVNGLSVGAPVKFMGVRVGQVTAVRLRATTELLDTAEEFRDWRQSIRIPVFYELDRDILRKEGSATDVGDPATVRAMVEGGMRAELAVESILTGRKYISLAVFPDSPMDMVNDPRVHAFELPTISTGLEWLERDVQGLMAKLTNLDVEKLVEAITEAATNVGELASGTETREALADIPGTLEQMRETMKSIRHLAASADTTLVSIRPRIDASSEEIQSAADQLEGALRNLSAVIEPGSPLLTNLEKSLSEIALAAAAFAELADYLQQNPSALLRGKDVEGN